MGQDFAEKLWLCIIAFLSRISFSNGANVVVGVVVVVVGSSINVASTDDKSPSQIFEKSLPSSIFSKFV